MSGTNGVSGSGNNFNVRDYKNLKLPELTVETTPTLSKTPLLSLNTTNTFGRENLDEISPYAGMGLRLSAKAPAGSVESYMKAGPEFGRWHGNFGSLNKQELAALGNLGSLCDRIAETKADVASHLQDSPFDCFTA